MTSAQPARAAPLTKCLPASFSTLQERTRSFDSFNLNPLESSLIDIMRAEQDTLKGENAQTTARR